MQDSKEVTLLVHALVRSIKHSVNSYSVITS